MDYSLFTVSLLIGTGFIAGIINTLAGGGSNLTLPALMVMGMPADIANATNRVGVFLQNVTATFGFRQAKKLDTVDIMPVMIPSLLGGVVGAFAASYAPETWLKPLLLSAMIGMTLIMIIRPTLIAPPEGTVPFKVSEKPSAWIALFIAGIYGGFVQAGVGFILIAALAGTLRYDLVPYQCIKNGLYAWLHRVGVGRVYLERPNPLDSWFNSRFWHHVGFLPCRKNGHQSQPKSPKMVPFCDDGVWQCRGVIE